MRIFRLDVLILFLVLGLFAGFAYLTQRPDSPWLEKAQEWPLVGELASRFRTAYLGPEPAAEAVAAETVDEPEAAAIEPVRKPARRPRQQVEREADPEEPLWIFVGGPPQEVTEPAAPPASPPPAEEVRVAQVADGPPARQLDAPWFSIDPQLADLGEQTIHHQATEPPVILEQTTEVLLEEHPEIAIPDTLVAETVVTPEGRIARARILRGPDHPRVRQGVIEALRQWRLRPARAQDEPVAVYWDLTLDLVTKPTAPDG